MPVYKYVGVDKYGKEQHGMLEGDSPAQIRHLLRQQDLIPLDVALTITHKQSPISSFFVFRRRLSAQDLAMITYQFSTLLNAGMPIEESLLNLAQQTEKSHIKAIILGVHGKIVEGYSLAKSLEEFPAAFSKLYCSSVAAGEKSGQLGEVLERLANYLERQQEVQQQVQQALIYPILLTVVSISIVTFLLTYVVPKIVAVFASTGQSLPTLTKILLAISAGVQHYGLLAAFIILILGYLIYQLLKRPRFKRLYHHFLLRIPVLGPTVQEVNTSRFARTFGMLFAASVPVLEAMRAANQIVKILPMHEAIDRTIKQVREGVAIHRALQETGYFSVLTIRLIASGEMSGKLETMLTKAADYQERMVSRKINITLALFEPAMIMLMGTIVLFIVLAIMLPIFEINQIIA